MLGLQVPNCFQVPPELMQLADAAIEQLPPVQQEPLHGLGEQVVPPRNVPLPAAHSVDVRRVQVVPLQQVPVGFPHGEPVQLVPDPSHSPPTPSHAESVRRVHEVPTQHAPVWAPAALPTASVATSARANRMARTSRHLLFTRMFLPRSHPEVARRTAAKEQGGYLGDVGPASGHAGPAVGTLHQA